LIVTDVPATGPTQSVFADIRTAPLSPLCTAAMGGGFDCNVLAPAVPGVVNTYAVIAIDAESNGSTTYSLTNEGVSPNAPGYGSAFAPASPESSVYLSTKTGTALTPVSGTNTLVSIILDPVDANMADDSVQQLPLGLASNTPGLLANPAVFVDNGGTNDIYVVVANTVTPTAPVSDTFGPVSEDADGAAIVNTNGTPLFVAPNDVAFPISVAIAPVVVAATTGVTLTPATTSIASPTEPGPLPIGFTYDGATTSRSPARIKVAETTPSTIADMFTNTYNTNPSTIGVNELDYVVAPFAVTPQSTAALGLSGTATITASAFGASAFAVTTASAGTCGGGTPEATFSSSALTTDSASGNTVATITVTSTGVAALTSSCTFSVVATFTPTTPPATPVTVTSTPITVNF